MGNFGTMHMPGAFGQLGGPVSAPVGVTPLSYAGFGDGTTEAPPAAPPAGADPKKGAWVKKGGAWIWENKEALMEVGTWISGFFNGGGGGSGGGGGGTSSGSSTTNTAATSSVPGLRQIPPSKVPTRPSPIPNYYPAKPSGSGELPTWVKPVGIGVALLVGLKLAKVI